MPDDELHHEHDEHDHVDCDRAAAREARRVVKSVVEPFAESLGAKLSPSCPLAPEQDHLLPHEQQKHAITSQQWRCNKCGKLFRTEHYLDKHLGRKHTDLLSTTAHACLGDYCDILQCPSWVFRVRQHASTVGARPCKAGEHDAARHSCSHLMHECFLAGGDRVDMHHVFEAMEDKFCAPLTCAGRQQIVERGATFDAGALAAGDGPGTGYYLLASVLIIGLAFMYGFTLCSLGERGTGGAGELRRRRRGGWFGGGAKAKAY